MSVNDPNIVELTFPADGLEFQFDRRIIEFHKSRHIQPRHGRQTVREKQTYSRWCFADLGAACDFIEQFGGAFYKPSIDQIAHER